MSEATGGAGLMSSMADYHLATGGKRLRALLPPWVCASLGAPEALETAITLGVGLELLHNGTLVHDDVQDGDALRRGEPTVWRRWSVASWKSNCGASAFCWKSRSLTKRPGRTPP